MISVDCDYTKKNFSIDYFINFIYNRKEIFNLNYVLIIFYYYFLKNKIESIICTYLYKFFVS